MGCSPAQCSESIRPRIGFIVDDSGLRDNDKCEFRHRVADLLATIGRSRTGRDLLFYFAASGGNEIEIESFGACAATNANGFAINPTAINCANVCGVIFPLHVAVYHELVHLWANRQGMNRLDENIAVGLNNYAYLGPHELRFSENKYRDQVRLPLRTCY